MRKVVITCVSVLLALLIGGRIVYVNITAEKPIIQRYPMQTIIPFGNDYYYDASERRDGYTIAVNGLTILTQEEFLAIYDSDKSYIPDPNWDKLICLLDVTLANEMSDSHIDLISMYLRTGNQGFQVDSTFLGLIYPHLMDEIGFKLRYNSEMNMLLPYVTPYIGHMYDKASLEQTEFDLLLSLYPVQKIVNITANQ